MKKLVLAIFIVFGITMLTSCTDNAEDNLQLNEKQQAIDPGNDGTIDLEDYREGE